MAIKSKDIPKHATRLAERAQRVNRAKGRTFTSKTFSQLTPAEKDKALKELMVRNGLIQDDDD